MIRYAVSLWVIGAGKMAQDYVKVLQGLERKFEVIGRNAASAEKSELDTGVKVQRGGLSAALNDFKAPERAIVAVGLSCCQMWQSN